MHPIERLRWIARADGESVAALAGEAAWTLGELSQTEPAAVLTAARRLLDRHPAAGPLWWVAARLIASDDPAEAASRAVGELHSDQTGDRLAEALRAEVASGEVVVVSSPAEVTAAALGRRGAYSVRFVVGPGDLRPISRQLAPVVDDVTGWLSEEAPEALEGASLVLVEILAGSPQIASVSPAAADLLASADEAGVPVWAVAGVGRALPELLARASAGRAEADGEAAVVSPGRFRLAVGPDGPGSPEEVLGATTAPPSTELLRRVV